VNPAELDGVLQTMCAHAARLAAGTPHPGRIRIETGAVALEVSWVAGLGPETGLSAADSPARAEPSGEPVPAGHHEITAPRVGVFHRCPAPGAPPFVAEGDDIAAGQQVGIVEAMKLMVPVEADRPGRVVAALCDDGAAVEFGTPLLVVACSGVR
jgi:acetyl-CoA carboxylase biotin carboxyl carrier protein